MSSCLRIGFSVDQSEEFEVSSHRGMSSCRDLSVGREAGYRRNSIHYIEEHTDEALEELIAGMSDEEQQEHTCGYDTSGELGFGSFPIFYHFWGC